MSLVEWVAIFYLVYEIEYYMTTTYAIICNKDDVVGIMYLSLGHWYEPKYLNIV